MGLRGCLASISTKIILRQARFAAEVEELDIEFRKTSVYDVGALGERFDLVLFIGVLYHLRHPLLALDLIHEHVTQDLLVFQSMQRGSEAVLPVASDYEFWDTAAFDDPGLPQAAFHRAGIRPRPDQLVGTESRVLGSNAAQFRLPGPGSS